jgi:hypothetical protein
MNGKMKCMAAAAVVLLAAATLAAQGMVPRPCCIAGEYKGSHIDTRLPNCPLPQAEAFTMTIFQDRGCGEKVWGKIVDTTGHVSEFSGVVRRGLRGCCILKASFPDAHPPGHVIEFEITVCLMAGKWRGKGTYKDILSGDPCKTGGTLQIQQI